jgi:hypothetical protein
MIKKRKATLDELVEAEMGKAVPNPFLVSCMEVLQRAHGIVDRMPELREVAAHSECVIAISALREDPTFENLQLVRAALDQFEDLPFVN